MSLTENSDKIVMAALKLARSHTSLEIGKSQLKTFSRAKDEFVKTLRIELGEVHQKGAIRGWDDALATLKIAGGKIQ